MSLPIINSFNPLRERVLTFKTNKAENGGYYILRNVQKEKNEPDFYDIWLLTDSIKDPEQHKML